MFKYCIFGVIWVLCSSRKSEMKTVKKGRPPRKEKRHVIWLTTSTLRLWNERREAFGLKNKSNSEVAEVLLHGMFLKRTGRFDCPDNNNNKGARRTLVVGRSPPLLLRILRADLYGKIFVACDNGLRRAHDMIYDCCVRQEKCRSILKHVLKRYDNRKSCL